MRLEVAAVLLLLVPVAAVAQQQKKPPAKPPEGWKLAPFSLSNKAAGFEIALRGYLQADFRSYHDWQVGDGSDDTLRADTFEWRRLRIGVAGEWRRLVFEFDAAPEWDEGDELKDARLGLRVAKEFQVDGGHMKVPVSPEWLTSPSKTDLIERAVVVDALAPGRDWGGGVAGQFGRAVEYRGGVFAGDESNGRTRAGTTAAGRLVLNPAAWLTLGGSYSQGEVSADPAGPELDPRPKGLEGKSATGYLFFPAVFVDGWRRRWGADARIQSGPVALWGEFLEAREERKGQGPSLEDLPDVLGRGWSTTVTWLVTGERKRRTIEPRHGLFAGVGAIELAARYEALRFDDVSNEGFEAAGSRARNVRPAGIKTFTGGVSWWPTIFLRFQGNVLVERYDDALRAPEPGRNGNYVSLVGRLQVHLP